MERHTRKIVVRAPAKPPRVEFDSSVMAWYLRFSNAKVAKTISEESTGYVYAIDLDARGELIGFELLGVREFSFDLILDNPHVGFSRMEYKRAKFVPAASRQLVEA